MLYSKKQCLADLVRSHIWTFATSGRKLPAIECTDLFLNFPISETHLEITKELADTVVNSVDCYLTAYVTDQCKNIRSSYLDSKWEIRAYCGVDDIYYAVF